MLVSTAAPTRRPLIAPTRALERRRLVDWLATGLVTACAAGVVAVLLLILGQIVVQGLPALNVAFFTQGPMPAGEAGGGVAPAILGSLEMLIVAGLIGIPLGVAAAIYLAEYGQGQLARALSFTIDVIAGFPSIVIGVFVWAWLVRNVVGTYNGLAGGVALAIIMIPIVARTVEETLRLVPDALREATLALGIPRWKTIMRVVLPTASAGVLTGIVLAMAWAGGESAPILLAALGTQSFNFDLFQPMASLPVLIYQYARSPDADWHAKAWGAALVLITLVALLSVLTRWILGRRLRALSH
ncbi:MAG TPA: phosphate ABC transporter permease PstA [Chloroflexota bacterium]